MLLLPVQLVYLYHRVLLGGVLLLFAVRMVVIGASSTGVFLGLFRNAFAVRTKHEERHTCDGSLFG